MDDYLTQLIDPPISIRGIDILKEMGIEPPHTANGDLPPLPVWNLGVRGTLRRVEIYGR